MKKREPLYFGGYASALQSELNKKPNRRRAKILPLINLRRNFTSRRAECVSRHSTGMPVGAPDPTICGR